MSSERDSAVQEGDVAPEFELFSDDGERWRLSEHRDRPVVLLFFPGAFTRVCTTELNRVNDEPEAFEETHLVGISTDAPFVLSEFRSALGFDFPLLSDHEATVCARYGAKYDDNFGPMNLDRIAKRAAFVIDREGVVQYAEVLEDAGNQPNFDALKRTLASLRTCVNSSTEK